METFGYLEPDTQCIVYFGLRKFKLGRRHISDLSFASIPTFLPATRMFAILRVTPFFSLTLRYDNGLRVNTACFALV